MSHPGPVDVPVTYTGGVLRPDHPLDLTNIPDGTRFLASLRPTPNAPPASSPDNALGAADPGAAAAARAQDQIRRIRDSGLFQSGSRKPNRDQTPDRR